MNDEKEATPQKMCRRIILCCDRARLACSNPMPMNPGSKGKHGRRSRWESDNKRSNRCDKEFHFTLLKMVNR
jgi:hypothetical protein